VVFLYDLNKTGLDR